MPPKPKTSREVKFPNLEVHIRRGEKAITVDEMKNLLGWEEQPEGADWGKDYFTKDENGTKVRCLNNNANRPFDRSWAVTIAKMHLNRQWAFNGQTITVGNYGTIISAQHRGVGLILAEQMRTGRNKAWYKDLPGPLTMEAIVVLGIEETPEILQTTDTGKIRTYAEYLFSDPDAPFASLQPKDRIRKCSYLDHAVRLVWSRTGYDKQSGRRAMDPSRVIPELEKFRNNHGDNRGGITRAVKHVIEEDPDGNLPGIISVGYLAALCYLMGVSGTEPAPYQRMKERRETKAMSFANRDKAEEFVQLFCWAAAGKEEGKELVPVLQVLNTNKGNTETWSPKDTFSTIAKAWNLFVTGEPITSENIALETADKDGVQVPCEYVTVGGIDIDTDEDEDPDEPNEEERVDIEDRKRQEEEAKAEGNGEGENGETSKRGRKKNLPNLDAVDPNGTDQTLAQEIAALKEKAGGALLLFHRGAEFAARGSDANTLHEVLKVGHRQDMGMGFATFPSAKYDTAAGKLTAAGIDFRVVEGTTILTDAKYRTRVAQP